MQDSKIAYRIFVWIIVLLICLTFALWGIHDYIGGGGRQNVVATVNGTTITQQQLDKVYNQVLREQQQNQEHGVDTKLADQALKQQVLQALIEKQVLVQGAKNLGLRVSAQQVQAIIMSLPAFQENHRFSMQRYQRVLMSLGINERSFEEEIVAEQLINQLQATFMLTTFALPAEVDEALKYSEQTRDIAYLDIRASDFYHDIKISDEQLNQYYHQHPSQFQIPEQVSIQYLQLSLPDVAKNIPVTEQQLQEYYQNNIASFQVPPQWHVAQILIKVPADASAADINQAQQRSQQIYQKLQKGADFAEVAKTTSDDIVSAKRGGDIGWVKPKMMEANFDQAVSGLQKPGQLTAPIRTQYGFNIIKLLAIKPGKTTALPEVKDTVRQQLSNQLAQQKFSEQSEKLADLTYSNSDTLQVASETLKIPLQTTDFFNRQGGKDPLSSNPKVITAAFSDDVLTQNYNSNLIQLDDEHVLVLRVLKHKPTVLQPFAEVKDRIRTVLEKQQAIALAEKAGEHCVEEWRKQQRLPQNTHYDWVIKKGVSQKNHNSLNPIIQRQAFLLSSQLSAKDHNIVGFSLPDGNFVVLRLLAVNSGTVPAVNSAEWQKARQQLTTQLAARNYQLFLQQLQQNAKIVVKNSQDKDDAPATAEDS